MTVAGKQVVDSPPRSESNRTGATNGLCGSTDADKQVVCVDKDIELLIVVAAITGDAEE